MSRKKRLAACAAVALLCALSAAHAAERSFRVSYSAPATAYLPLWAAKDAGFFERRNLKVEILYVGSSPIALSALLNGEIDVLAGGGTVAPVAYANGFRDLALFATLDRRLPFKIYAAPAITDLSRIRGKRFGVTRFGGTLDFATRYFLKSIGLDVQRDVRLIQIGNTADILAALINGSVDVGTLTLPYNFIAKKSGYRELADLAQTRARYATAAFLTRQKLIVEQRGRMESLVQALVEAIHFVKSHPEAALNLLQRYTRSADREISKLAYDEYAQKIWPRLPHIEPEDIKLILEHLAQTNSKAREIHPAALIDNSLVENVARSGLVEQLYK